LLAFVVLDLVLIISIKPTDWLGRTSPKWPILCRVGRRNLNSINQSIPGLPTANSCDF